MKKSTFTSLFLSLVTSVAAYASEPIEVCRAIQNVDGFSSTQKNASDCRALVASGSFDSMAADVCLTIAKIDGFSSTQTNALKCLQVIKNKSLGQASNECLAIVKSGSFSSDQTKAIQCLAKAPQTALEHPKNILPDNSESAAVKSKKLSSTGNMPVVATCPKNQDCWSEAVKELKTKYNCKVAYETFETPDAGQTLFGIHSTNCKIMKKSSEAGLCPSGSQARAVSNLIKICVPESQSASQSAAAQQAVN